MPTEGRLLRPAGYTLSKEIEAIAEQYDTLLFAAFMCALVAVGGLAGASVEGWGQLPLLASFGVASAWCTAVAWRKLQLVRRKRLGLLGEQTMGDLLGRLARVGNRVFHDVPGDEESKKKWNVDHVVVGPGGVFRHRNQVSVEAPDEGGRAYERGRL